MSNSLSDEDKELLELKSMLQRAIAHHRVNELQAAEKLYRAILKEAPSHPDANHNLGVIAVQVKNAAAGLAHFKSALKGNPNQAQYWFSYIDALILTRNYDDAMRVLADGLAIGLSGKPVEELNQRLKLAGYNTSIQNADSVQSSNLPDQNRIDALVSAFTSGDNSKAHQVASLMSKQFPNFSFGWKVLGAIEQAQGRLEDSLVAMKNAAMLAPDDEEIFNNLGLVLQALGQYSEAENCFSESLRLNQGFRAAQLNLAVLLQKMARLPEAKAIYERMILSDSRDSSAQNNLAVVLQEIGDLQSAEVHFRQAIKLTPNYVLALYGLANVLQETNSLVEATSYYKAALRISPGDHNILFNLGTCLAKQHLHDEAIASFNRSLKLNSNSAKAHFNLANCLLETFKHAEAEISFSNATLVDNEGIVNEALIYLSVLRYLNYDFKSADSLLLSVTEELLRGHSLDVPSRTYGLYLLKLLEWHKQQQELPTLRNDVDILQVIGESHALSTHGQIVNLDNRLHQCNANWIWGCKQWHLRDPKYNKYKYKFEAIMKSLPRSSSVLLLFGEIDCRLNEGILAAYKRLPNQSLKKLVIDTIYPYVRYVKIIAAAYQHKLTISGVPAISKQVKTAEESSLRLDLVAEFNSRLKSFTLAEGLDFLDLYQMTIGTQGYSNDKWHLDGIHLVPSSISEACQSFLIKA